MTTTPHSWLYTVHVQCAPAILSSSASCFQYIGSPWSVPHGHQGSERSTAPCPGRLQSCCSTHTEHSVMCTQVNLRADSCLCAMQQPSQQRPMHPASSAPAPSAPTSTSTPSSPPATRFLILLEGSVAMMPHWLDFRGLYVEPLLRAVDRGTLGACEMSVVVFYTSDPFSEMRLQSSGGWTQSVSEVRHLLDGVQFCCGANCSEVCLTDALSEALYLQSLPSALAGPPDPNPDPLTGLPPRPARLPCHCLLLLASDVCRFTTVLPLRDGVVPIGPGTPERMGCKARLPHMYDYNELIHVMRSDDMTLSVVGPKDRNTILLTLFVHCRFGPVALQSFFHEHREQLTLANVGLSRQHMCLVSPGWAPGREVLHAEKKLLAAQSRTLVAQQQGAHHTAAAAAAATQHSHAGRPQMPGVPAAPGAVPTQPVMPDAASM
eukprot:CAMPEP_0202896506 /NCGR_PEP_ID=MMETSP1392-20130828/5501_1 /ASSEMBLY_ACC=CAM_ASM_000868 /TAXON_ID=225041 /ORGANISM="Chlamydomonas chlamydogama, Strain SAG 11-48b" /LENGTH=433 /DNA_ID=CAMNT_0049581893 /DNA_START=323 /DNA_END=1624 /DNA_ORIENTATION=-